MKRFLSIWGFGTALLLLPTVVSSTANVTVNFQGSFVNPTCSFSVNNGNSVNLGTYSNTYFNTNTSTPIVGIPIAATGCITGISTIHLSFSGTADSSNNQLFAANSGSGVAGVAIELLAASTQARITPGSSVDWTVSIQVYPPIPTTPWCVFTRRQGPLQRERSTFPSPSTSLTTDFTSNRTLSCVHSL